MAIPNHTDAAQAANSTLYKSNIDATAEDHETRIDEVESKIDYSGKGCLVYFTGGATLANSQSLAVVFNNESYDTDDIHDLIVNPSRLIVPVGVTKIKLSGKISFLNSVGRQVLKINKNGSAAYPGQAIVEQHYPNSLVSSFLISSPMLKVSAGDYFQLVAEQYSGSTQKIVGSGGSPCWFNMQLIA